MLKGTKKSAPPPRRGLAGSWMTQFLENQIGKPKERKRKLIQDKAPKNKDRDTVPESGESSSPVVKGKDSPGKGGIWARKHAQGFKKEPFLPYRS